MNVLKETPAPGTSPIPKAKMSDSVFTNLFRIPKYALQLYQSLHPEDQETTEEQIRIVTLENVLLNQPYNDFGMVIKGFKKKADKKPEADRTEEAVPVDKTLVLCEAQSTWSVNILVRVLIYWAQTLKDHIVETTQNMYSSKRVRFPSPEFYVIFTGDRKTRPAMISLSKEFGLENADLKIRMIYDGKKGDIINQYVTFVGIYKEQYKLYGRTQKTIQETIRICMNRNILREYLETHRKEVVDIMMSLFDDDVIMEAYTKEVKDEGRMEGRMEGRREGRMEGQMEEKRNTAVRLKGTGLTVEAIAKAVDVNVNMVKQWLASGGALTAK